MTAGKNILLRKYSIIGDFAFLNILHPTHILYIKNTTFNTIDYLFVYLDQLEPEKRDNILGWIYFIIIDPRYREPVTGNETMGSLMIDEVSYDVFKQKCLSLVQETPLDQFVLTHYIVNTTLQFIFNLGDTTSIEEVISRNQRAVDYFNEQITQKPEDEAKLKGIIQFTQENIQNLPGRVKDFYELYVYFCEHVVQFLLVEEYLNPQ
jgi:hypothetical protein